MGTNAPSKPDPPQHELVRKSLFCRKKEAQASLVGIGRYGLYYTHDPSVVGSSPTGPTAADLQQWSNPVEGLFGALFVPQR